MNFTIYADNSLIYNRSIVDEYGEPQYLVRDPVLNETVDEFCSLTYRCNIGSPAYDLSVELIPRIKVYEDGNLYWTGRILKSTPNINAEKEVYVEDFLGVLCDSIYRPFEFYGSPAQFLQDIVAVHNEQVSEGQQIYSVVCDITNVNITRSSEGYNTCWQIIKQKLLDMIGGYMWIEYDSQERPILHYSLSARNVSTQKISFGKNLLKYRVEFNFDGFYTALVPLGAKDNETKQYVTIESVNDGKDYLIDETNAAIYGIIYAPATETTWKDVHEPSILLTRAQSWLQNKAARLIKQIDLEAQDLSGLNVDLRAFHWLDSVPVEASEIDDTFIIKNLSRPLNKPLQIAISMGDSFTSLTGAGISQQSATIQRIEKIEADYVMNEDVSGIVDPKLDALESEMLTEMTSIRQDVNSIISTALSNYVASGDFEQFQQEIVSQISQLPNSITATVSETISQSIKDNNTGYVNNKINEIYAFIRLISTGVVIGSNSQDNPSLVKMKLTGNTLYFFTGDEENVSETNCLAYFSSDQLVVNNSRIQVLSVGAGNAYMHFSVVGSGNLQCLFLSPKII